MKKPFNYLMHITKEIEETATFPYAAEEWAVLAKIEEGSITFIKLLNNELNDYLYGNLKKKREELTDEQIQQIEDARKEAMKKAESVFGPIDCSQK